jgi:hypothetical protein
MRVGICCIAALIGAMGIAGEVVAAGGNLSSPPLTVSTPPNDGECKKKPGTWVCECEEEVSKLRIVAPQGMALVHVANCARIEGSTDLLGSFLFKGMVTVSGEIEREADSMLGDIVMFKAKNHGEYSQFASAIYDMRIPVDANVIKKFQIPTFTDKAYCWAAEVVITVRELEVRPGDSDEAGNYVKDFDVQRVGQYSECKSHQLNQHRM